MAELNIRMIYNRKTGKHDIFVDYESDMDALPFEHEQDHRALLQEIMGASGLSEDQVGQLKIQRLTSAEKGKVLRGEELEQRDAIAEKD